MAAALSDRTIERVKATVPALEASGTAITDRMYQRLFRTPAIRDLFNQSHRHARARAAQARTVAVRVFYNAPAPGDVAGRDDDARRLISAAWLAGNTPLAAATYYICGPRPFLRAMIGGLARTGVPLDRIRYEFFGPADELLAG